MTDKTDGKITGTSPGPIVEFGNWLDVYGADLARWPSARRNEAQELLRTNGDARRLYAEAQALDGVLAAAAPLMATDTARVRDGLMSRLEAELMTAADGSPQPSNVVSLQGRRGVRSPVAPVRRPMWREAMLLAAALLLGVFAGTAGVVDRTEIAALGFGEAADSEDISVLAFGSDLSDTQEEGSL